MNNFDVLEQAKALCRQLGIIPTKSKGQNFLVSEKVLAEIVAAADLGPEDVVLEIGPGLGILTEELIKKAKRVVAVELDKKLFNFLSNKFKGVKNLELIEGDIISLFPCFITPLFEGKKYKVVANLPYQITSHILRLLLESTPTTLPRRATMRGTRLVSHWETQTRVGGEITELVLMVQKEVGERICAKRGEMSVLSVMVQYYSQPEMVAVVSRDSFWPMPEVDSVIIHIKTLKHKNIKTKEQEQDFFKLVKIGFSGKRKMLKNNLRNVYEEERVLPVLKELGLDLKIRAEDLGVEEWVKLYKNLKIKM
ncbi:MAG TPA: 16S rRNA (adenine(1518)-N(6)/adenine(1519)-N(6))-dimethyltransferase RsmA [Patescibacteria group bacterium]|nr:16S rRNA (adenine(1518)-N(6)/adenine(1519)-N(6))-dimethyltransferase RsmA [Patescibacteria group bacterium]